MALFEYIVWFKDLEADPSDQAYEWVACFLVEASTANDAKNWGNKLSISYAVRTKTNEFLNPEVNQVRKSEDIPEFPIVEFGVLPSGQHLGG